jgi:hypothetical protein
MTRFWLLGFLLLTPPVFAFTRVLPGDNVTTVNYTEHSATATNDNTIWDPAPSRGIVLMGACLGSATGGAQVRLENGSTGEEILGPFYVGATAAAAQTVCVGIGELPIWEGNTDVSLSWSSTGANASVTVYGYEQ